jgi:two-component system response regulator AlgR
MDILVVDDEPLARERLVRMVNDLGVHSVTQAGTADEALEAITEKDPSVVLLDIEMPGKSGIELAQSVMKMDVPPAIIFTTAYDQYALDAFDTPATAYLLKPIQEEKLQQALEQAKCLSKLQIENITQTPAEKIKSKRERISAKTHRGLELIAVEDIRFFKADHKYVEIFCIDKEVLFDETLKDLEQEFADTFVRVHRNALVSIEHIQALEKDGHGGLLLRLSDIDSRVVVSRRYASKIKSLIKSY